MGARGSLLRPRLLRGSRGGGADRGDSPIEMAIIAAPLITITLLIAHLGGYFYARSVAFGAASQGANAARSYDVGERGTGPARAQEFIDTIGLPGLADVVISQRTTGTMVTVTVTGRMPTLIPGFSLPVTQSATRPIERFTR